MPNTELIANIRRDIKRLEELPVPVYGILGDHRKETIAQLKSEVTRLEAEDAAKCTCNAITPAVLVFTEAAGNTHYTSCPKYFDTAKTPTPSKTAAVHPKFITADVREIQPYTARIWNQPILKDGKLFADVYGSSPEHCEENAADLINAMNALVQNRVE